MASNRIKGITIEIGGDTTELQKALKNVNKQIRDTQSSLRTQRTGKAHLSFHLARPVGGAARIRPYRRDVSWGHRRNGERGGGVRKSPPPVHDRADKRRADDRGGRGKAGEDTAFGKYAQSRFPALGL